MEHAVRPFPLRRLRTFLAAALLGLSACAAAGPEVGPRPTASSESSALQSIAEVTPQTQSQPLTPVAPPLRPAEIQDPFESVNRGIFAVNEAADRVVVEPTATVYRGVIPQPLRDNLRSFLRNLGTPVTLANNLLQGDWSAAETTATRFFINSTLGLGGFADVATAAGHPYQSADFGQTLARWGVGPGPYVVLPLLGPSSLRDSVGTAVDILADPVGMTLASQGASEWALARTGSQIVDTRSRFLDEVTELRASSVDYYATQRSIFWQSRLRQTRWDADDPRFDLPDFEDFEDFDGFEGFEGIERIDDALTPHHGDSLLYVTVPPSRRTVTR